MTKENNETGISKEEECATLIGRRMGRCESCKQLNVRSSLETLNLVQNKERDVKKYVVCRSCVNYLYKELSTKEYKNDA